MLLTNVFLWFRYFYAIVRMCTVKTCSKNVNALPATFAFQNKKI